MTEISADLLATPSNIYIQKSSSIQEDVLGRDKKGPSLKENIQYLRNVVAGHVRLVSCTGAMVPDCIRLTKKPLFTKSDRLGEDHGRGAVCLAIFPSICSTALRLALNSRNIKLS
jgi:hypothetical protein